MAPSAILYDLSETLTSKKSSHAHRNAFNPSQSRGLAASIASGLLVEAAIEQQIAAHGHETCDNLDDEAFFVADLGEVYRQHIRWKQHLPRIRPYFAVKCNPDPIVLHLLHELGTGFDCASKQEIQQILDIGVSPDRIIYAQPCKAISHLRFSARTGVRRMTFDNADELYKIQAIFPEADLLLRSTTDDSASLCRLSQKFGVGLERTGELLALAKKLDLNVVGVAFHCGSGASDASAFVKAVRDARVVFDQAKELGLKLHVLDCGGGFVSETFDHIANTLAEAVDHFFPPDIEIIAEPGRFFTSTAFSLACNVIARRTSLYDNRLYINDGIYGNLSCIIYDHQRPKAKLLRAERHSKHATSETSLQYSIWGPTCDGIDCIDMDWSCDQDVRIGDWLLFENMGAYTKCSATRFNGFPNEHRTIYELFITAYFDTIMATKSIVQIDQDMSTEIDHSIPPQPEITAVNMKHQAEGAIDDARAWTYSAKRNTTYLVSLYKLVSSMAASSPSPALVIIGEEFGTRSKVLKLLPLSAYLLGYTIGPLIITPLADAFGRIRLLQISNLFFVIFNLAAGFSNSNATLITLRVLSGIGGCGALTLGGGILRDCWTKEERTKMISVYSLPAQLGPAIGPIMGAFISKHLSWRWTFWIVSMCSGMVQVIGLIFLRETRPGFISTSQSSHARLASKVAKDLKESFQRPLKILKLHAATQLLAVYSAFAYGLTFLAIVSFHGVWSHHYSQAEDLGSLNFLALACGFVVGSLGIRPINEKIYEKLKARDEKQEGHPEYRAPTLVIGALLVPSGLLLFGWTAQARLSPIVPDLGVFIYAAGIVIVLQFTNLYVVDVYEAQAASAMSGVTVIRSLVGFGLPLVGPKLFEAPLEYGWGNSVLALIAVAIGWPLPMLIWNLGRRLRARDAEYQV
ncbi:Ornithine decarboxylase [Pseudocercospora fuligena]|uniref:ornithine decarboxylase n=1 Tax=Pseudocercospora fuligena TaxID=685502 RepID=A0A8H6RP28_9PEZI|nr:Ornithine decarboxylase [Pseudocercospora fuligena]